MNELLKQLEIAEGYLSKTNDALNKADELLPDKDKGIRDRLAHLHKKQLNLSKNLNDKKEILLQILTELVLLTSKDEKPYIETTTPFHIVANNMFEYNGESRSLKEFMKWMGNHNSFDEFKILYESLIQKVEDYLRNYTAMMDKNLAKKNAIDKLIERLNAVDSLLEATKSIKN